MPNPIQGADAELPIRRIYLKSLPLELVGVGNAPRSIEKLPLFGKSVETGMRRFSVKVVPLALSFDVNSR